MLPCNSTFTKQKVLNWQFSAELELVRGFRKRSFENLGIAKIGLTSHPPPIFCILVLRSKCQPTSTPLQKVYCKQVLLSYFGSTLAVSQSTDSREKTSWSLLQQLVRILKDFRFLQSQFALERAPPQSAGRVPRIQILPRLKKFWSTHVAELKM